MKILICSDGSEQSERALQLGLVIAVGCKAEATFLGIKETPGEDERLLDSLKHGQRLLEGKKLPAELIVKTGDPIAEIVRRTQETKYDLVVIGAARKGSGRFWMSSKSYKIIKAVRPPVLVVSGLATEIKRVLICTGGKPYIDEAVRLTGHIARGLGAAVTLVHVLPEPPAIYAHLPRITETVEALLKSHSELGVNLLQEKQRLESLGVPTEVRLRWGAVLEELLREIRSGGYDMVVTGSALSYGLRTYVLGDISREIINRAECAVLVVRSRPTREDPRWRFRGWWGLGARPAV